MCNLNLAELQRAAGAVLERSADSQSADFTILHFGDSAAESAAGRTHAALIDLGHRTVIDVLGKDRTTFLHNFCTNDIKGLEPGRGCEAFVTNINARVLAHVFVSAEPDRFSVFSFKTSAEPLMAHWNRYILNSDVRLQDRSAKVRCLLVTGPQSASVFGPARQELESLPVCGQEQIMWTGAAVHARHVDWLGSTGYLIVAPASEQASVWQACVDAGAVCAGTQAFHSLRIEACFPLDGIDITDDSLAQEVGRTKRAISFSKGCYLGQEPIARIEAVGHVNRLLRGLRFASGDLPARGSAIRSADDNTEIGSVTSAARSGDGSPVALAYLRQPWTEPGTQIHVVERGVARKAQVFAAN